MSNGSGLRGLIGGQDGALSHQLHAKSILSADEGLFGSKFAFGAIDAGSSISGDYYLA